MDPAPCRRISLRAAPKNLHRSKIVVVADQVQISIPVEIRHLLVRDAIYAGLTGARRRVLHARAASVVGEAAAWAHRVAALDHPDEGLAAELERLAG